MANPSSRMWAKRRANDEGRNFVPKKAKVAQMPNNTPLDSASAEKLVEGMSPDQRAAFTTVVDDGKSVFLTGPAGCGKSWLLGKVIEGLKKKYGLLSVFVTASTGTAALNIEGTTLHSFAGCGLGGRPARDSARTMKAMKVDGWLSCCCLIIDEISMISPAFFNLIDEVASIVRKRPLEPFGGIQVIVCGDFFQLPPVLIEEKGKGRGRGLYDYGADDFQDDCEDMAPAEEPPRFVFESDAWKRTIASNIFQLTTAHRQSGDTAFRDILNACREGKLDEAQYERLLENVAKKTITSAAPGVSPSTTTAGKSTTLYSRKTNVQSFNDGQLNKLDGNSEVFAARDWCDKTEEGTKAMQQIITGCIAPRELSLKVGALVILLKNLLPGSGLVNGSQGIVVALHEAEVEVDTTAAKPADGTPSAPIPVSDEDPMAARVARLVKGMPFYDPKKPHVTVVFDNGLTATFGPQRWSVKNIVDDQEVDIAYRDQIPLTLGFALTIHKSQGMTLAKATVDISGSFECGMAYVALSRATSLEGLVISRPFDRDEVYAHPKVVAFYKAHAQPPVNL